MGFLAFLFCVCAITFIGLLFGLKLCAHFCPTSFLPHNEKSTAIALYSAFLLAGLALSVFSFLPFSVWGVWALSGFAVLGLRCSSFSKKWKRIFSFLLCLGAVLTLYQLNQTAVLFSCLFALFWWGIWSLYVWFDRFAFVSFLTSVSWMIALFSVGAVMHTVPASLMAASGVMGAGVLAVSYFRLGQKKPILGPLTASLAGFIWAGIWTYFLTTGAFIQVLTGLGYYLFEGIFLVIALYFHRPLQTFLERLLAFGPLAPKAVRILFSHLLILSFLSAMTLQIKATVAPVLIFALAVVLIDLYLRLNTLLHPQPAWRELFKNTKDSLLLLTKQAQKKEAPLPKTTKKTRKKRKTKK
ncbi:MAG: hypothetical protein ACI4OR_04000 [Alphaproteobacteria bacterium]